MNNPGTRLLIAALFMLFRLLVNFSILKMYATCSFLLSLDIQRTTWPYIPEERNLPKLYTISAYVIYWSTVFPFESVPYTKYLINSWPITTESTFMKTNNFDCESCQGTVSTQTYRNCKAQDLLTAVESFTMFPVAARSKVWTAFVRSNAGIMGSKPTRGINVCVRLLCLCVVLCVDSGLATDWTPVQEFITDCL
jgi:hypothetical protein